MPCLMWGKRHMADRNQNAAEPHAVIITPVYVLILTRPVRRTHLTLYETRFRKIGNPRLFAYMGR